MAQRPARALPRHDSPIDAAAAQGNGIQNRSRRAEAVTEALARLSGDDAAHEDLLAALAKAGLDVERAEAEVARMLAMDRILEPRPGRYRWLGGGSDG